MRVITKEERVKIIDLLKKKTPVSMVAFIVGMNKKYIMNIRDEEGIPKNKPEELKVPSKSKYKH